MVSGRHAIDPGPSTLGRAAVVGTTLVGVGAGAFALADPASAAPPPTTAEWGAIVHCESGGRNVHTAIPGPFTAQGYFQITIGTWLDNGGGEFAPTPMGATFAQQQQIADRIHAARGFQPWDSSKGCWGPLMAHGGAPAAQPARPAPAPHPPLPQTLQSIVHEAAPAPGTGGAYTVARGDTLSGIARQLNVHLADLYAANRAVIGGDINLIRPGQLLTTPTTGAHAAAVQTVASAHAAPVENPAPSAHLTQPFIAHTHLGVDLAAPLGTPIYAAFAGTVDLAGPANGFGNWIVVTGVVDGQTVSAVYGHERYSGLLVRPGEPVSVGEHIGNIGDGGDARGAHLHFEVWPGGRLTGGSVVDPMAWMHSHGL